MERDRERVAQKGMQIRINLRAAAALKRSERIIQRRNRRFNCAINQWTRETVWVGRHKKGFDETREHEALALITERFFFAGRF